MYLFFLFLPSPRTPRRCPGGAQIGLEMNHKNHFFLWLILLNYIFNSSILSLLVFISSSLFSAISKLFFSTCSFWFFIKLFASSFLLSTSLSKSLNSFLICINFLMTFLHFYSIYI
jgi:hypothetical protein